MSRINMNKATNNRFVVDTITEIDSSEGPEEFTSFDTFPISVICPFKHSTSVSKESHSDDGTNTQLYHFVNLKDLELHLLTDHLLLFSSLKYNVLFLKEYLTHYAKMMDSSDVSTFSEKTSLESAEQLSSSNSICTLVDLFTALESISSENEYLYLINPSSNEADKSLRDSIQKKRLHEVLELQVTERYEGSLKPRLCLFCTNYCTSIPELFSHMYKAHGFNIGLPDNLVYIDRFLNILENKLISLQCIYCEKQFTSPIVLRKHMRKKKHFKISPRNHLYDQFYIVNYSEPGKDWKALENEKYDSDDDKMDNSWDEWLNDEDGKYRSLFDSEEFETPEQCLKYMTDKYNFDLAGVQKHNNLSFYEYVTLINFIRLKSAECKCYQCDLYFGKPEDLVSHFVATDCSKQIPSKSVEIWNDPQYLKPVLENDSLFSAIEITQDD